MKNEKLLLIMHRAIWDMHHQFEARRDAEFVANLNIRIPVRNEVRHIEGAVELFLRKGSPSFRGFSQKHLPSCVRTRDNANFYLGS